MPPEDIAVDATVALARSADQPGVVRKRIGQRVRVDFSQSGGKASTWVDAKDLVPTSAAPGSDDESVDGSESSPPTTSRRGGGSPVPVPLTERFEGKLGRKKLELEVVGMGLQTFDTKGKPVDKWIFQNMLSWEPTDKGFDLTLANNEVLSFSCERGEQLCQAMREKATVLAEEHALRQTGQKKLDLAGFLDTKGYAAYTLRVKEAMHNTGITEVDKMVGMLQDMTLSELDDFIQSCKITRSTPPPPPPPPPPPSGDSGDDEDPSPPTLPNAEDPDLSSRDKPAETFDVPESDQKFDAKWRRKQVKVQASGMSLQVYGKNDQPVANYLYQQCASWGPTAKGFHVQHIPDKNGFAMIEFTCAQGQEVCDLMTKKAQEMMLAMKEQKAAAKRLQKKQRKRHKEEATGRTTEKADKKGEAKPTKALSQNPEPEPELTEDHNKEAAEITEQEEEQRELQDSSSSTGSVLQTPESQIAEQTVHSKPHVKVRSLVSENPASPMLATVDMLESALMSDDEDRLSVAGATVPLVDDDVDDDEFEPLGPQKVNLSEEAVLVEGRQELADSRAADPARKRSTVAAAESEAIPPSPITTAEPSKLLDRHDSDPGSSVVSKVAEKPSVPGPSLAAGELSVNSSSPWLSFLDDEGDEYWYNETTHETVWTEPSEGVRLRHRHDGSPITAAAAAEAGAVALKPAPVVSSRLGHAGSSKFLISHDEKQVYREEEGLTVQQLRHQIAQLKASHNDKIKSIEHRLELAETTKRRELADADVRCQSLVQQANQERARRQELQRALTARRDDETGIKAAEAECDANCAFLAQLELYISRVQTDHSSLVQNASTTVFHLTERLRETEEALEQAQCDALEVAAAHQRLAEIHHLQSQSAMVETALPDAPSMVSCDSQTEPVKLASDVASRAVEALKSQCAQEVTWQRDRAELAERRVAELEEQVHSLEMAAFATDVQHKTRDRAKAYELAEAHEVIAALSKDMSVASQAANHTQRTGSTAHVHNTSLKLVTEQLQRVETDLQEARAGRRELESQLAAASKQAIELQAEMQEDASLQQEALVWAERILEIFIDVIPFNDENQLESDAFISAEKELGDQAEQELQAMRLKFQQLMRAESGFETIPEPESEPYPNVEMLPKSVLEQKLADLQHESERQLSEMASELRNSHEAELKARETAHALRESEAAAVQAKLTRLRDEAVARYDSAVQRAHSAEELVVPYQHQLRRLTAEAEAACMRASEAERVQQTQEAEAHKIHARLMQMVECAEEERAKLETERQTEGKALLELQARYQALESDASKIAIKCEFVESELARDRLELQRLRDEQAQWQSSMALAERTITEYQNQLESLHSHREKDATVRHRQSSLTERAPDEVQLANAGVGQTHTAFEHTKTDATCRRVELAATASKWQARPQKSYSSIEPLEQMRLRLREMEQRARTNRSTTSSPTSKAVEVSAQYDIDSGTWHYHRAAETSPSPRFGSTNRPPPLSPPMADTHINAATERAGRETHRTVYPPGSNALGGSEARAQATLSKLTQKLSRVQSDLDEVAGGMLASPMT